MVNQEELSFNYGFIVALMSIAFILVSTLSFPSEFKTFFNIIFLIWIVIASIILWRLIKFKHGK
jgi:prepilin signal peptidase PulO-like enzyme (type II secretory pathway)